MFIFFKFSGTKVYDLKKVSADSVLMDSSPPKTETLHTFRQKQPYEAGSIPEINNRLTRQPPTNKTAIIRKASLK